MRKIAIATHTATVNDKQYDGIGNSLKDTLNPICEEYIFVRHSMDGLISSEVQMYREGMLFGFKTLRVIKKPAPLRYLSEIITTLIHFTFKEKIDVYVGVDPLNALSGILLKKIKKIEKVIFYTADYSPSRFGNKLMDGIYHRIDRYCVDAADEVWSVSSKIVGLRKEMGLSDEKNIFVPNVPPIDYNYLRKNKHDKYTLVTSGIIDKQLDFEGVIRAIKRLVDEYPEIRFMIIGNGPEEKRLKELVRKLALDEHVLFTGRLPLSDTLERVSKAGIGLALYTGIWGFNRYGDSTKCREYFSYGLPVLSTDTHSTVDEIRESNAGIVTEMQVAAYVVAIKDILTHYDSYSKRSLTLGKKYEGIHKKQFLRVLKDEQR